MAIISSHFSNWNTLHLQQQNIWQIQYCEANLHILAADVLSRCTTASTSWFKTIIKKGDDIKYNMCRFTIDTNTININISHDSIFRILKWATKRMILCIFLIVEHVSKKLSVKFDYEFNHNGDGHTTADETAHCAMKIRYRAGSS